MRLVFYLHNIIKWKLQQLQLRILWDKPWKLIQKLPRMILCSELGLIAVVSRSQVSMDAEYQSGISPSDQCTFFPVPLDRSVPLNCSVCGGWRNPSS